MKIIERLFEFIFAVLFCLIFCFLFLRDDDNDKYSEYRNNLIEQERDEREEERLEKEARLQEDYGDYCFDMERINWEGHCRDILFDLGPPPPEYTSGKYHAYFLVRDEARAIPLTNPIVKIPTFEEYKKQ